MASIRKRNGRWQVQVRKNLHAPLSKSFLTKADALSWAKKVESEIERSVFRDPSEALKTPLEALLTRYKEEVLPSKRSQKTVVSQIRIIEASLGTLRLIQVTPGVLAKYRDQRLQAVGSDTVKKDLSLLHRVFNIASKDWGIFLPHGNPVNHVRLPSSQPPRTRRLEAKELGHLLGALSRTPIVRDIVQLAIETGLRREEITNMDWRDINLPRRTIAIPRTKTNTPRTIPLSTQAHAILLRQSPDAIPIKGPVFKIRPDSISQAFQRACRREKLLDLRFHDLRHEATSRLFETGLNVMEVASITGHRDPRILQRYTHLRAEDLAKKLK